MDVLELVIRGYDPDKVAAVACGKCKRVAVDRTAAERCCDPRCACGEALSQSWRNRCDACDRNAETKNEARRAARDVEALRTAKHVPAEEWDRAVAHDGPGDRDGYYDSVGELVESYEAEELQPPAWVWGTRPQKLGLNAEEIISDALEQQEHHEDARDWVSGVAELQAALDAWLETHSSVETWWEDKTIAVILDADRVAQLLAEPPAGEPEVAHG